MPGPSSWPCRGSPASSRRVSRAPRPAGTTPARTALKTFYLQRCNVPKLALHAGDWAAACLLAGARLGLLKMELVSVPRAAVGADARRPLVVEDGVDERGGARDGAAMGRRLRAGRPLAAAPGRLTGALVAMALLWRGSLLPLGREAALVLIPQKLIDRRA